MTRVRMAVGMCLALAGCVTPGTVARWQRADGKPAAVPQLQADVAVCEGDRAKADLSAARQSCGAIGCLEQDLEIKRKAMTVFNGCMAQKGYSPAR